MRVIRSMLLEGIRVTRILEVHVGACCQRVAERGEC